MDGWMDLLAACQPSSQSIEAPPGPLLPLPTMEPRPRKPAARTARTRAGTLIIGTCASTGVLAPLPGSPVESSIGSRTA